MFNSFVNSYEEIVPYLDKEKNILDVGCGSGLLVDYLIRNGYQAEGCDNYQYDRNTKQMIEIVDNYMAIHKEDIYSFNSKKKYDLIFLSNVIEHFEDWQKALRKIEKILKDDGVIVFLFPNYSFKVELHFMLPIILNKNVTYSIFKQKIHDLEKSKDIVGLWDSLNFIKPIELLDYFENKNYELFVDKEYFSRMLNKSLTNSKKNSKKKSLVFLILLIFSRLVSYTGFIRMYKFIPLAFHPFVKVIVKKTV
tara:strand:- start:76936 stop:77688 length:753 start_codon:yes stop_codon:yes gene_type:complete